MPRLMLTDYDDLVLRWHRRDDDGTCYGCHVIGLRVLYPCIDASQALKRQRQRGKASHGDSEVRAD